MPIKNCKVNNTLGKKWGNHGKCYTGSEAETKAKLQAKAAYASGYKGEDGSTFIKRLANCEGMSSFIK